MKKPQLLATFENWGWEVAKQFLNFLAIFEPEPLATQLLKKIVYTKNQKEHYERSKGFFL